MAALHPGVIPTRPDIGAGLQGKRDFIVEFANVLAPLASGKVDTLVSAPEFARKHSSALLSAAAGGQWPQARKASVPKWNITDNNCQLCHEAVGTLEHRMDCPFIKPAQGWAPIPEEAKLAADTVGKDRLRTLRATGLLAIKLPAKNASQHDTMV